MIDHVDSDAPAEEKVGPSEALVNGTVRAFKLLEVDSTGVIGEFSNGIKIHVPLTDVTSWCMGDAMKMAMAVTMDLREVAYEAQVAFGLPTPETSKETLAALMRATNRAVRAKVLDIFPGGKGLTDYIASCEELLQSMQRLSAIAAAVGALAIGPDHPMYAISQLMVSMNGIEFEEPADEAPDA